jgi:CRP-like cAMP-binding protein
MSKSFNLNLDKEIGLNENSIKANIVKHIKLNDSEWNIFFSLLDNKTYNKGEFVLKPGEVCNFHGFILSGFLRTYFLDKKEHEINLVFHTEDWWFADIASFVSEAPSKLNIVAMEDTVVFIISRENLEILFEKIPKFERFFRILNQRTFAALMGRYIDEIATPAKDRYFKFIEMRPTILNRVSLQHIASFLGITKEYLSKIRSDK